MAEFHFVEDYEKQVAFLIANHPLDEAMSFSAIPSFFRGPNATGGWHFDAASLVSSPEVRVRVSQSSRERSRHANGGLRAPHALYVRAEKHRNQAVLEMRGFLRAVGGNFESDWADRGRPFALFRPERWDAYY